MLTRIDDGRSPFHAGERSVQEKFGVREIETWARQVVRDHMPEQHREFFKGLPFLVAAARDEHGRPWATVLPGPDGFLSSPDPRRLHMDGRPAPGDALQRAFVPGADVGILGIELASRRRNRANGRIGSDGQTLMVDQSFGNCPQYIRERLLRRVPAGTRKAPRRGTRLSADQQQLVAKADTFFIASGFRGDGDDPAFGMDASHRGGERGFVEVIDPGRLRFPDYAGNNHFNTIGNLLADPRAGFLFVDFATGSLLQITGRAAIDWQSDDLDRFPGARQLVTLEIDAIVEQPSVLPLRWDVDAQSVRSLRLVDKIRESADVTSFVFEARDGGPLPAFSAGQHLPVEFAVAGVDEAVRRTYSLSGAPDQPQYRISVKRQHHGLASNHLHDRLDPGDIVESRNPAGEFVLPATDEPLVLVGAGVGVTPLISMLHDLAARNDGRQILFVHGVRDGRHHPFADEVRAVATDLKATIHVAYSHPDPSDCYGRDYDSHGRVSADLLRGLGAPEGAHYFLCGPAGFMAGLTEGLTRGGVAAERIHTEAFGPAA